MKFQGVPRTSCSNCISNLSYKKWRIHL